jgi:hypothetical protein
VGWGYVYSCGAVDAPVLLPRRRPHHEAENRAKIEDRADDQEREDEPDELRADAQIGASDETDDRVAPQDHHGDHEDDQQDPRRCAERKNHVRRRKHGRELQQRPFPHAKNAGEATAASRPARAIGPGARSRQCPQALAPATLASERFPAVEETDAVVAPGKRSEPA